MANQELSDEPMYVISIAARLVEMHPQTLRYYERAGLVKPTRSRGRIRLYSQRDIERLRKIARLVDDLGVNLAGVEVILHLTEKLQTLQQIMEQYNIPLAIDYNPEVDFTSVLAEATKLSAVQRGLLSDGRENDKPTRIPIRRGKSKLNANGSQND